jgi:hypothetical protein
MTQEDIIKLAREAGFAEGVAEIVGLAGFERFAALVAAAENEACAQLCDWLNGEPRLTPAGCAAAIRARGQE